MAEPANLNDVDVVIGLFERAAERMRETSGGNASVRLPAHGRLLATGDIHDNPFHLRTIVKWARLDASPDHHVVLHELIHGDRLLNGMDFSFRMLGRVAELALAYPGQVHPMLANHELAQLTGRAVSKGAGNSTELFDEAVDYAFGDDAGDVTAAIGGFIRAMPLAVLSEGGVCCAHSLPTEALMHHFDVGILDRPLTDEDYAAPRGSAHLMTWGRAYTEAQVEALAEAWNVKLFCLGHMHAEMGIETKGERVLILNSDHDQGRVVPIDLADVPTSSMALLAALPVATG